MPVTNIPKRNPRRGLSTSPRSVDLKLAWEIFYKRHNATNTLVDGVFEGGGALGAAYAGALRALEEQKIWFHRVAGASAGAITAALIAVGYTAQEIEWLCSSYFTARDRESLRPPSLLPELFPEPINFLDFLDAPANARSFTTEVKKNTLLWNALNGTVIDKILDYKLTEFITLDEMVNTITNNWPTLNNPIEPGFLPLIPLKAGGSLLIRRILELVHYPEDEPTLRDFLLFPDETQRNKFADNVWNFMMDNSEALRLVTNLMYNGYLFQGDVFLRTMKQLLGAKKFGDPTKIVKFSDLKIPLTVIASDTNSKTMKIYGSGIRECNNMDVTEAVRQSMSIPFAFQPRANYRFMDGGMCSNYPYWLYSAVGSEYVVHQPGDNQRIKLGFILDDDNSLDPAGFGCYPAKWHRQQAPYSPYEPGIADVLKENFGDGRGQPNPIADSALDLTLSKYKILDVMDRQQKTMDKREWHLHDKIAPVLMKDLRFYEIKIPVKGYHWLDFKVNSDRDDFTSIADRGYMSTMHTLIDKAVITVQSGWKDSGPYH